MKSALPYTTTLLAGLLAFSGAAHAFEPVSLQFGSDFDGDGGLLLQGVANPASTAQPPHPSPSEWTVTADSLRYELPAHGMSGEGTRIAEAGALIQVPGLGSGNQEDFMIQLKGEVQNLTWDFARIGVLVLGDDQMGATYSGAGGYAGYMRRPNTNSAHELRIGTVAGTDWGNLASTGAGGFTRLSQGQFTMTLTGLYNDDGDLVLSLTVLAEGAQEVFIITTATLASPQDGSYFGIAMRLGASVTGANVINFHSLSISEPVPQVFMPFQINLGSAEGRDPGENLALTEENEASLEPGALRLSGQGADYLPSLATASVGNFQPGRDFLLQSRMTLVSLGSAAADNAAGHVVLGDYHAQWLPNASGGSRLRIREGVSGNTLAETAWTGLHPSAADPNQGIGATYTLETRGAYGSSGELELTFSLTDETGFSTSVSTTEGTPLTGDEFGFGAWHRAAETPVWDFHDLGMGDLGHFDFEPFEAPFALDFGSDTGKDGLDGLLRNHPRPEDWSLTPDSVRYERNEGGFQTSTTSAVISNYMPGQDFTLEADMTLAFLASGDLNRVGFVVLGREHDPFASPFNPDFTNQYYTVAWLPRLTDGTSDLRIRNGFTDGNLATVKWEGLHPSDADPFAGLGEMFHLKAEGVYDSSGSLELSFTLTDPNDYSQTITAVIENPIQGNVFGIGGRMNSEQFPMVEFHNFSVELGEAPVTGPTFEAWQAMHFTAGELANPAISGPQAAPAGDGVANLLKYAANLSAWTPATGSDLGVGVVVDGELRFAYPELTGAQDIEYVVEVSQDLTTWNSGPEHTEEISRMEQDEVEDVVVRALLPGAAARGFIRVRIQEL